MSALSVHVDTGTSAPLVVVELVEASTGSRTTHALAEGRSTTVDVAPGSYLVRTVTPDGRIVSDQAAVVPDQEAPATVLLRSAPRATGRAESRGPRLRAVPKSPVAERSRTGRALTGLSERVADLLPAGFTFVTGRPPSAAGLRRRRPTLWARLWSRDRSGGWEPLDWPEADVTRVPGGADVRLSLARETLHALAVGAPGFASRIAILPPVGEVLVRARVDGPRGIGIDAQRTDEDERTATAESLLAYLSSGQLTSAAMLSDPVVSDAEELLFGKVSDPLAAVVGGLFLLRTRELERLHDWPRNLADWFGWLPDASVVRAAQLLAEPDVPREELRSRLLAATAAGVPLYTDSLEWLYEGLLLLAPTVPDNQDVQASLERIRRYTTACDRTAALTTFGGPSPAEPTPEDIPLRRRPPGWAPLVSARAAAVPPESRGHGEPGGVPGPTVTA